MCRKYQNPHFSVNADFDGGNIFYVIFSAAPILEYSSQSDFERCPPYLRQSFPTVRRY